MLLGVSIVAAGNAWKACIGLVIMPRILSLSSQVAHGHVGFSATGFVWQRLGFETTALPTVILSNRPDHAHCAGEKLTPGRLDAMLTALEHNGFLDGVTAFFTGYLPSADHVALAARWVRRMKEKMPDMVFCCDPISGDDPDGLYIPEDAACALRDMLVPEADMLTPNRFELSWVTGRAIGTADDAAEAAISLGKTVLASSSPARHSGRIGNIVAGNGGIWQAVSTVRYEVPHGTGDFIAAALLAHRLRGLSVPEALARAAGSLEAVIEASAGALELNLIGTQDLWVDAAPWPVEPIGDNIR